MCAAGTKSRLRRAESTDLEAVTDLTTRAFEPWVSVVGGRPAPMDADYRAVIADGSVFVTESDGCIDGVIVLVPSADALLIESVAVRPERQRLGLGRRLLVFAEATARAWFFCSSPVHPRAHDRQHQALPAPRLRDHWKTADPR
jgi:GNAT superfamily N-acetyltransferase